MTDDLIEQLRFCGRFHSRAGYPENGKLFAEAADALTAGGSEFFAGKLPGSMYKADLKRCAEYIRGVRQRDHQRWLTSYERGRLKGLDEAKALAGKDSETLPSNCSCRYGRAQSDICSRATARNLKYAIEALKTRGN